jgi:hypothetical protein
MGGEELTGFAEVKLLKGKGLGGAREVSPTTPRWRAPTGRDENGRQLTDLAAIRVVAGIAAMLKHAEAPCAATAALFC